MTDTPLAAIDRIVARAPMPYAIGMPILQDDGEFEWPLYFGETLIGFFPNVPAAELAAQAWIARIANEPSGA